MHAFWTVLLMPVCLIAASMTVARTANVGLNLRPGSASKIWWSLAMTATAILCVVLVVDVAMWLAGGIAGQPQPASVSVYAVVMRAVFRCLTAVDFPIIQIVLGAFVGYGLTRFVGAQSRWRTRASQPDSEANSDVQPVGASVE